MKHILLYGIPAIGSSARPKGRARIETGSRCQNIAFTLGSARPKGRARIETRTRYPTEKSVMVAPVRKGGRGLKRDYSGFGDIGAL